ncbi:MAG: sigma-70 family RNA polymerase sigma factor [Candidatus Peribacteraceae bacterium]|nr:sigma-70 family RNA polymerase sigma factor [Candidatus Peribacteraceae bacterium]
MRINQGEPEVRTEARNKLVTAYLPLIAGQASRRASDPNDVQDLIQEACLSLIRAAEGFDLSKGKSFSKYAETGAGRAMNAERHRTRDTIHIPSGVPAYVRTVEQARQEMEAETGKELSWEEVGTRMGLKSTKRANLAPIVEGYRRALSKGELSEGMRDADGIPTHHAIIHEEKQRVANALTLLPYKQRYILGGLWGIGVQEKSAKQIALELDISVTRVNKLKIKATDALRSVLEVPLRLDTKRVEAIQAIDARSEQTRLKLAAVVWKSGAAKLRSKTEREPSLQEISSYFNTCVEAITNDTNQLLQAHVQQLYQKVLKQIPHLTRARERVIRGRYALRGKPWRTTCDMLSEENKTSQYAIERLRQRGIHTLRRAVSPQEQELRKNNQRIKLARAIWKRARVVLSEGKQEQVADERIARCFGIPLGAEEEHLHILLERARALVDNDLLDDKKSVIVRGRFCLGTENAPIPVRQLMQQTGINKGNVREQLNRAIERLRAELSQEKRQTIQTLLAGKIWSKAGQLLAKENGRTASETEIAEALRLPAPNGTGQSCPSEHCHRIILSRIEQLLPTSLSEKQAIIIRQHYCLDERHVPAAFADLAKQLQFRDHHIVAEQHYKALNTIVQCLLGRKGNKRKRQTQQKCCILTSHPAECRST